MHGEEQLAAREQEILQSIVRAYILTGEPVSSRSISRRRGQPLSAASIRNVMADLADEGYLSQPHTSAGRIPTEKAFRSYVQSLAARPMSVADAARVRAELSEENSVEGRLERTSHILTELTLHVGIAAALPTTAQVLDRLELLALADQRVLMILVTADRQVHNRVITVDQPICQDELNSLRNYVNHNFSGWVLGNARRELLRRFEEERAIYDDVLRRLNMLYQKGLLEVDQSPEVHMDGASNLVGHDLHLTRERMRDLFRALEEKKRLLELLDRFLEQPAGELGVRIGLEEAHPAMKELALIGMSFPLPSGMMARVAVLGPMRMHYERAMSAVLNIGRAFGSLPT
ncbi:MAG TPA: heat-inducible transcriptional repressor HrcA [Bryobacteraceae bacterium]|nr:heat-inducible transcriptional repressor HrcA [Bryobacteraceae bacterium]